MRLPYFATIASQHAVVLEAHTWIGTPFVPHGRSKGHGVDCVSLLAEIYIATGFLSDWKQPTYFVGAGQHLQNSVLEDWLVKSGWFDALPSNARTIPGDLLTFALGRVDHHVGLKLDGTRFIHAHPQAGVIAADLRDPTFGKRLRTIWRPCTG